MTESLRGKRVVCMAGIGNPEAFAATVESLGANIVARKWFADHYHYRRSELNEMFRRGRFGDYDYVVTTEKDAVKLRIERSLTVASRMTNASDIVVVAIKIDFCDDGDKILTGLLKNI